MSHELNLFSFQVTFSVSIFSIQIDVDVAMLTKVSDDGNGLICVCLGSAFSDNAIVVDGFLGRNSFFESRRKLRRTLESVVFQ